MGLSTRDLTKFPPIDELRETWRAMAMLDAILSPEWDSRYYSFNSKWAAGEQMAVMRNGSGDEVYALFSAAGCVVKGFDHESTMGPYNRDPEGQWPGLLAGLPEAFAAFLKEAGIFPDDITFCVWRQAEDTAWRRGDFELPEEHDPDGSAWMLDTLCRTPEQYREWAMGYYEQPIVLAAVRHVYARKPLTEEIVKTLNPDQSLEALADDIAEIGYIQ